MKSGKLKIAYVLQDGRITGPFMRSWEIAGALRDQFDFIFVLPSAEASRTAHLLREDDLTVRQLRLLRPRATLNPVPQVLWLASVPSTVSKLVDVFVTHGVDIVYVNTMTEIHAPLAARHTGTPLIWHMTGMQAHPLLERVAMPLVAKLSDRIVCSAKTQSDYLHRNHSIASEQMTILFPPVDTSKFFPKKRDEQVLRQLGIGPESRVVGMVGNLNPVKGHSAFIRMAHGVVEAVPNTSFIVVGKILENRRDYYSSLVSLRDSLGLQDRLIFAGQREDMTALYSVMDVFVLPSISEVFPMVVLEAMAMAKPVVVTDVGGIREMVDHRTCGLVSSRRPEELATCVLALLEDPILAARIGSTARDRVKSRFDVKIVSQSHARLYSALGDIL